MRVGHGAGWQQPIDQLLEVPLQAPLNVTDLKQFSFAVKALKTGEFVNKKKPLRSHSIRSLSGFTVQFSMSTYLHVLMAGIHPGALG